MNEWMWIAGNPGWADRPCRAASATSLCVNHFEWARRLRKHNVRTGPFPIYHGRLRRVRAQNNLCLLGFTLYIRFKLCLIGWKTCSRCSVGFYFLHCTAPTFALLINPPNCYLNCLFCQDHWRLSQHTLGRVYSKQLSWAITWLACMGRQTLLGISSI